MGIFCSTPDSISYSHPSTFEQMMSTSSALEPLIIWCDPNIKTSQYQEYIAQINRFCKFYSFTDAQQAIKFMNESKRFCHVITDGENAEQFQAMHNLDSVCSIYLFSQNAENHRKWTEAYHKTILVESNPRIFLQFLNCHLRYTSPFRLHISLKEVKQNDAIQIPSNQNLNTLLSTERFFQLAKKVFPRNSDVESLEMFYRNPEYDKLEVLKIYAQETFLYKMVNNSMNMSLGPEGKNNSCEFIIKDLQKTIKEQYQSLPKNFSGVFYKTGIMPLNLQLNFQSYLNKDVETKHFIIANKKKEQILKFVKFSTISPQEIALLTIIVPQLPENNSEGFMKLTPDLLGKIDYGEELLFNTCSKFRVLGVSYAESDELAYPQVALLYGFDIINQHLQDKNPEILIEKIDIFKKFCSKCERKSQDNFLYLDLCDPTQYFCKRCTESIKSCFLCVSPYLYQNIIPDVDQISGTKLNAMAVSYPSETTTPFYGYTCSECNKIPAELCFHCINDNKKWCKDCQKDKESCLLQGHEVILETSPYSFWSKGSQKDSQERIFLTEEEEKNDSDSDSDYARGIEAEQEGRYYDAMRFFENERMAQKNTHHTRRISMFYHLALNSTALEHFKSAEDYLVAALKIITDIYGPKHQKVAEGLINLGQFYASSFEDYDKAEEKYNEAFEIKLFVETQKSTENITLKNLLPIAFKFLKQYPKPSGKQGDVLNLFKALTTPKDEKPNLVSFLFALESAYKDNGNDEGAQECSQFLSKHVLKSDLKEMQKK